MGPRPGTPVSRPLRRGPRGRTTRPHVWLRAGNVTSRGCAGGRGVGGGARRSLARRLRVLRPHPRALLLNLNLAAYSQVGDPRTAASPRWHLGCRKEQGSAM
jgi:hypothetical protein